MLAAAAFAFHVQPETMNCSITSPPEPLAAEGCSVWCPDAILAGDPLSGAVLWFAISLGAEIPLLLHILLSVGEQLLPLPQRGLHSLVPA